MVMPKPENTKVDKEKIKSFYDMMKLVYSNVESYIQEKEGNYTKDYLINSKNKNDLQDKENEDIQIEEFDFQEEEEVLEKFSKNNIQVVTKEEVSNMKYGTKIHEILEFIDFRNPNYQDIEKSIVHKIKKFIESDIIQNNLDAKFYKEFEFTYKEDNKKRHGIIDLMIENEEEIIIIDYKLKNTEDPAYQKQLKGYQQAISHKSQKNIYIYLYSILDETFYEIGKD